MKLGDHRARFGLFSISVVAIGVLCVGAVTWWPTVVRAWPAPVATATATSTPEPTATPTETPTETPTATPLPTATPVPPTLVPTSTPSPAPSPTQTALATPTTASVSWAAARIPAGAAPILMYHYIRVNPVASDKLGYGLSVTPLDFAAQMQFLSEHGYRTMLVPELLAEVAKPRHDKIVALTFDDGYADAYSEALPVLRRYGMRATFYVISGFVGHHGYLSPDQAKEMAAAGMEIGSHTVNHPDLTHLDALGLRRELGDSRASLESLIGGPVLDFCYPSGKSDPAARAAVDKAGYRTAVTTQYGFAASGQDPLLLPRVRISGGMTLPEFAAALGER